MKKGIDDNSTKSNTHKGTHQWMICSECGCTCFHQVRPTLQLLSLQDLESVPRATRHYRSKIGLLLVPRWSHRCLRFHSEWTTWSNCQTAIFWLESILSIFFSLDIYCYCLYGYMYNSSFQDRHRNNG